jgi:hypothetical protein
VIEDAVVLPNVHIGRGVRLRRVIIDKGCVLPDGFSAGIDPAQDRLRFHVSERGVTLVAPRCWSPAWAASIRRHAAGPVMPVRPTLPIDAALQAALARHGREPHALVQMLIDLQARNWAGCRARCWPRWPPRSAVTLGHVEGVAGFYRFLHLQPVGRYRVLFSDNVIDRQQGSRDADGRLCHRLGVAPGERARRRRGQRGHHVVHRPGRPGAGAAGQPPPGGDAAGRERASTSWQR